MRRRPTNAESEQRRHLYVVRQLTTHWKRVLETYTRLVLATSIGKEYQFRTDVFKECSGFVKILKNAPLVSPSISGWKAAAQAIEKFYDGLNDIDLAAYDFIYAPEHTADEKEAMLSVWRERGYDLESFSVEIVLSFFEGDDIFLMMAALDDSVRDLHVPSDAAV